MREAELRVSLPALAGNARAIRGMLPRGVKLMAVVKADAYGHGLVPAAQAFLAGGADALAVALVEEAGALRAAGLTAPILVLGGANRESAEEAVRIGAVQAVFTPQTLGDLQAAAEKFGVRAQAHLKIDTGMARIGARGADQIARMLDAWRDCPAVDMAGIFTHFAACGTDDAYTAQQDARFRDAINMARAAGFSPMTHAAATDALACSRYRYDMARPGLALYGCGVRGIELRAAQTLAAKPVRIERIPAGETVSYGRTFSAPRDMTVMTVPVGYGDGYPRALSNRAHALVLGRRAPLIGRVCMDMTMFDITDIPGANLQSEVVLLGAQGADAITPAELAEIAGTIPYEIMLGFLPRLRRAYVRA
ncbi:MAG: alanine racemase [Christensenellales bacterium]